LYFTNRNYILQPTNAYKYLVIYIYIYPMYTTYPHFQKAGRFSEKYRKRERNTKYKRGGKKGDRDKDRDRDRRTKKRKAYRKWK